jgi:hypothetical protein
MTNDGQGKNGFGRADLLWGMFAVDIDQQARDKLALSLGFEVEKLPMVDESTVSKIPVQDADGGENTNPTGGTENQPQTNNASRSTTASYYRITGRHVDGLQDGSETDDLSLPPEWFTQAKPTILDEAQTRIPPCHRVIPLHTELTRWSRLEPFLKKILGANIAGMQVDAPQLVRQVATGQSIRRIPRKLRPGWSEKIRVLIDINGDNFPYRSDFLHLRDKFVQVRGMDGLELQYIHDEPGGNIVRYEQYREYLEAWSVPDKNTPLLILSDLGMQSRSPAALYGWLVFGQLLNVQGIRPLVLMPVAERDIDKKLLRYFDCFVWDGSSELKRVKGAYQADADKRNHEESITALLGYFFAALRVDVGLLRAVRYLLPGEQISGKPLRHQPFDIGHETAIWRHRDTVHEGDEWGWQANSREAHQEDAVKLLKQLDPKKREQLVALIGRYHALLPDELYFEAMYNLMLLAGLDKSGELAGMLPTEVWQETERYLQDLVKTYAVHTEHDLLDGWVKRHLVRNQAKGLRGQYDYWLAFMAYSHLHQEQREGKAEMAYPDFLTPEEIAEISRYINHAKAFRRYQLKQQGEKLVLVLQDDAGKAKQATDDWGKSTVSGALLLNLSLNDERIFHLHTDRHGNRKLVSLNLDKIKDGFDFPANGKHEFQIGQERLTVDVSTAQQQKEPWMTFIASGSDGLYAESQTNAGDIYRWYWHPPEWSRDKGILPGAWYGSKQLDKAQRDTYGFYTDITIAGIPQRFRWIEPTAFQMGSPKGQAARESDEIQHEVILTQGYWLAETTCTQALWQAVMGDNPSSSKGENNPVENVSWQDVTDKFLKRVNKQHPELKLRLPTEAEWENACRAGTSSRYSFGNKIIKKQANFNATQIAVVKSYPPNQWGLYEMHGNVWEWCLDWYGSYPSESVIDPQGSETGSFRVLRGGSWFHNGGLCRSACRSPYDPGNRYYGIGFRLALGHELSPVRSGRAVQQPIGSHAAAARGGQAGDGQRGSSRRKKK